MPNESFPRNWFSGSEYRPQRVENMATYVRDKENPLGTYVAFKILSATHAKLMVSLHQNLAPAIKRHAKHGRFGEWRLIGVTEEATKRTVFMARLIVNGE